MTPDPKTAPDPAAGPAVARTEWIRSAAPVDYGAACAFMETRVEAIRAGLEKDCVWLLEHPALYTGGTSAKDSDLLRHDLPVHATGRGGQYTYHGPGQRVAYAMIDLAPRGRDLRAYVRGLEEWMILSLADLGVTGARRDGRVGIWVDLAPYSRPDRPRSGEAKIGAIGVRVRKWVAFHGLSVNVHPDLSHFDGIVPCGIRQHGVTSLADLGLDATMADLDRALEKNFTKVF